MKPLSNLKVEIPRREMYMLVEFTDEKNVAVIPDSWLDGTSCAVWPDDLKGPGQINRAVFEKVPPKESWPAYPIRELYRNGENLPFYFALYKYVIKVV